MPMTTVLKERTAALLDNPNLALYVTSPTEGTAGVEVPGYAHIPVTVVADPGDAGLLTNDTEIPLVDLPECDVVAVGLWDEADTDLLHYEPLSSPRHFEAGDDTTWQPGDLAIRIF